MEIEVSASIKRRVVGAGVLATTAAAACVLFLASTRVEPAATASASPAASGFSPVFPLAVEPLWFAEPDGFQLFGFGFLLDVQFFYNQPNPPPPVRTLIDSGSATLSACDASVADGRGALIVKTTRGEPVGSCNAYGNGAPEGFWGYAYNGGVRLGEAFKVAVTTMTVMQETVGMTCASNGVVAGGAQPLGGIFGIGPTAQNQLAVLPADGKVPLAPDGQPDCDQLSVLSSAQNAPNPVFQMLDNPATPEPLGQLGISWNGALGEGAATLFLDEAATDSALYRAEDAVGPVKLSTDWGYGLDVTGFELADAAGKVVGDVPFVASPPDFSNAIVDTGNGQLVFPTAVVAEAKRLSAAGALQPANATLFVQMAAADGSTARLPFALESLLALLEAGLASTADGAFVFGSIGWLFFDIVVLDVKGQAATFVPRKPADGAASFKPFATFDAPSILSHANGVARYSAPQIAARR